ncbi:MAG TPA: hypothetical protein VIA18_10190 [Polyangia bacterium]|nr:hypothetical protein [Polyangia bacterium]
MPHAYQWIRVWMVIVGLLVAAPAPARESLPAASTEASAHVAAAIGFYRSGDYDSALAELEVGYAIEPRLEFLISFAQVYGAMGRYAEAIDRCRRYLDAQPRSALAPDVERLLGELRARRERADATRAAAGGARPASPPVPLTATVAASLLLPPVAAPPDRDRARRRRIGWAVGSAVGVVVVGLAVGLGLGFGLQDNAPATKLGTVSFH